MKRNNIDEKDLKIIVAESYKICTKVMLFIFKDKAVEVETLNTNYKNESC